jgi:outer membrane protein
VIRYSSRILAASVAFFLAISPAAIAETLKGALAKAYENNSELNAARAGVRVTDEGVAIAKSGYRPTITGEASTSYSSSFDRNGSAQRDGRTTTGSFGVTITQTLFDGFRTKNSVAAAESQVLAQRENLRNSEQNILFDAASAYMDVIRDRQIAAFRKKNLSFLQEQVRAANARFEVGEGTRTDVAQANASRAAAIAQLNAAEAQAKSSAAVYRQVIGEDPGKLEKAPAVTKLLPKNLDQATELAAGEHPAIRANFHVIDATEFGVKVAEGALLPTLGAEGRLNKTYQKYDASPETGGIFNTPNDSNTQTDTASVGLQLTVPIYQGGRGSATVRQEKERLGQARINMDVARDQVRAALTSSWTQLQAAQASVTANKQLVAAAQLALDGVVEERKVGQRTTLDVLNAQKDVTDARISQAQSERDVVVASYAVLSATGRLSVKRLGLGVAEHKPEEHYKAVKDKWFGLRTPDGR